MFDQRLEDLIVEEAIIFPPLTRLNKTQVQLNGTTLDGKKTWVLITISENLNVRLSPN